MAEGDCIDNSGVDGRLWAIGDKKPLKPNLLPKLSSNEVGLPQGSECKINVQIGHIDVSENISMTNHLNQYEKSSDDRLKMDAHIGPQEDSPYSQRGITEHDGGITIHGAFTGLRKEKVPSVYSNSPDLTRKRMIPPKKG